MKHNLNNEPQKEGNLKYVHTQATLHYYIIYYKILGRGAQSSENLFITVPHLTKIREQILCALPQTKIQQP
jgi:hypothetical protein